jgi:hypothetical protein
MRRPALRAPLGWPPPPLNAKDWVALPEIPLGRYLLADMGWISCPRDKAVAAGVLGLPLGMGQRWDSTVALPAVVLRIADGTLRMFRLPTTYAAAVKSFVRPHDGVWDEPRARAPAPRLPCHFVIGDRETVYLVADGQAKHLN